MKVHNDFKGGFTLVEIMIVVAIIALLAAIAIPNFVRARNTSQKNTCVANLRMVDGAVQQWALELKKGPSAAVGYTDISVYMKNSVICPSGGTDFASSYTIVDVQTLPLCNQLPTTHKIPSLPAR